MQINGTLARTAVATGVIVGGGAGLALWGVSGANASQSMQRHDGNGSLAGLIGGGVAIGATMIGLTAIGIHNGNTIMESAVMGGVMLGGLASCITAPIGYSAGELVTGQLGK